MTAPCGTPRGKLLPLLVVPSLRGADGVDGTTVSYLLAENLKLQKKEEEKKRRRKREEAEYEAHMQELDRRVQADVPLTPAESRAWRKSAGHVPMPTRRKKKRKKKKLPKSRTTSSSGPQLQYFEKVVFVVAQRQIPMVVLGPDYFLRLWLLLRLFVLFRLRFPSSSAVARSLLVLLVCSSR